MDLEYDQKFEEMKKYIPFLENMIKRLENTHNGNDNPRKAQLDKIRSLRDLLLDKKKRMKMENLLKCEQVLVNLYAKVEQRDSLADNKNDIEQNTKAKNDLNVVRNKLKSVVSKLNDDPGTLPEIARATKTEVDCVPGSKEPALFQRRPNKVSPGRESSSKHSDDIISNNKRHYTRVLTSPEPKKKEWTKSEDSSSEKPLFSRRSPRRSPRRYSPSYKKERKKSSKQRSKSRQQIKDLNITLKVPEESLSSLNTKDILSRIINCSDNDVDIATLRGLRSQILGELKQTGAKDDISDLILKSYKKKGKHSKKKAEVEEGEISDSESETIENIYGSLVVMNKDESASTSKVSNDNQPRKIQICLVINSEKDNQTKCTDLKLKPALDVTDFEAYEEKESINKSIVNLDIEDNEKEKEQDKSKSELQKEAKEKEQDKSNLELEKQTKNLTDNQNESLLITNQEKSTTVDKRSVETSKSFNIDQSKVESDKDTNMVHIVESSSEKEKPKPQTKEETYKLNFYQPLTEEKSKTDESNVKNNSCKPNSEVFGQKSDNVSKIIEMAKNNKPSNIKPKREVRKDISEIDILQALKNEILGESVISPSSDAKTPPLHQPKISKVSSAQQISNKKRISIESYKQKSYPPSQPPLFILEKSQRTSKDDGSKKKILKLTEKECERFNFPATVAAADSSDDAESSNISLDDVYGNSAPQSPDHDDFADTGIKPPVIIPSDPIKNLILTKSDIDMRTLMPTGPFETHGKGVPSPLKSNDNLEQSNKDKGCAGNISPRNPNSESPFRTEINQPILNDSSNLSLNNFDKSNRTGTNFLTVPPNMSPSVSPNIPPLMSLNMLSPSPHISPIMTPILNSSMSLNLNASMQSVMNPNMTPSRAAAMIPGMNQTMTPIMTPNSRSYEMTPRPNFDDDYGGKKHVYAPIFPTFESETDINKQQSIHWEKRDSIKWEDTDLRKSSSQRDIDYQRRRNDRYSREPYNRRDSPQIRMDCPGTPNTSFGGMDCPPTPNPSFGRMDCPATPNPSFGRMDCPSTPNPSFGRMDCPSTPNPSFGRMDCTSTPNPSFGRMESPMTPVHPFGRSDGPMPSNHPYSRSESNAFGRGDYNHHPNQKYKFQDPRLNRSSDYDNYQNRKEYRGRSHYNDNQMSDTKYRRDREKYYDQDNRGDRERISRRDTFEGRSGPRDYDNDRPYKKDHYNNDYRYGSEMSKGYDDYNRRRNQRARSIGRTNSTDEKFSPRESRGPRPFRREDSTEKVISVQSHSGRSFDIDTSFNRTFQETVSSSRNMSFDARRQRAASVGRSLPNCAQENKHKSISKRIPMEFEIPDRTRAMNFRRASSVGRELKDYNVSKNFKDIKADLRSYKFENYDKKVRDRDDRTKDSRIQGTKESSHRSDQRNKSRENDVNINKNDDGSKYSPKKNFRDPRVRRDLKVNNTKDIKNADGSRNSSISRNNNHGIVYSNDNIAKGTLLASAAGVRNFKIPKIKRPTDEKAEDASKLSENNTAKDIPSKCERKSDEVDTTRNDKVENKGKKSVSSPIIKQDGIEISKNDGKEEKSKKQTTGSLVKKNEKEQSQEDDIVTVNSTSESCERRITRSAKKDTNKSKQLTESPVKKLRRIKKPLVYDSDSDSETSLSSKDLVKQDSEKEKLLEILTDNSIKPKNQENKIEQGGQAVTMNQTENSFDSDPTVSEKIALVDNVETKSAPTSQKELCEEPTDSLDINFSVDEEIFADNMATSSVLDNINALIADLDNDIEAPKINDFNDRFIKNIVGSISSNDSPIPLEINETDLVSDIVNNEKQAVNDTGTGGKNDIDDTNLRKDETIIANDSKCENSQKNISNLPESNTKTDVKRLAERNVKEISKSNIEDKTTQHSETLNVSKSYEMSSEFKEIQSNVNNDATVSTTDTEGKVDEVVKSTDLSTSNTEMTVESFVPDSTNNFNDTNNLSKDFQGNFPDSTNEVPDLNSDITSTHVSADTCTKELSSASASSSDNIPRLDSIGKLLSMLEDKNKIKELLLYIGKDSIENEKLKKKLEKLSKIVSDDEDEDTAIDAKQDNKKGNSLLDENQKDKNSLCNTSHKSLDKKESDTESKESHEKLDEYRVNSKNVMHNKDEQLSIADKDVKTKENEKRSKDPTDSLQHKEIKESHQVPFESLKSNEELVKNDEMMLDKDSRESTNKNKQEEEAIKEITSVPTKKNVRKSKITKRGRSRLAKKAAKNKEKRVTRSDDINVQPQPAPKKPSRELLKLQEDIREMFISEDILNATGIRMCRLAKMVGEKSTKADEPEPVVLLEKIKDTDIVEESLCQAEKVNTKKNSIKSTPDLAVESKNQEKPKYKPGPKSKTKKDEADPYAFETDSIGESSLTLDSRDQDSDSDSGSIDSNKSGESSELLVELKKKIKRKRRGNWQSGVIRTKSSKRKRANKQEEVKSMECPMRDEALVTDTKEDEKVTLPQNVSDVSCFTDKNYCFYKNVTTYSCRLCTYSGNDIVLHYKKQHPHSEIPLSRLNPTIAKLAIEQCEKMNLQAVSKIKTSKYACRFCFKVFNKESALETFFWHVVSAHTGEYKHLCFQCVNVTRCPFNLDIPPPPKNLHGQLIGYICGRCNFTQVSLENLKTHVIVRHDDEQTEVYSINLAEIPKKKLVSLLRSENKNDNTPRTLRSTRSNQSLTDRSDDLSDAASSTDRVSGVDTSLENSSIKKSNLSAPKAVPKKKIKSKFVFENDDNLSDISSYSKNDEIIKAAIKSERDEESQESHLDATLERSPEAPIQTIKGEKIIEAAEPDVLENNAAGVNTSEVNEPEINSAETDTLVHNDVLDYPHFKIKFTGNGSKEYICCINRNDNHYKTTLLISLKKHVQMKHSEIWDGYCSVCKVIVTSQGSYKFKDCLQHFLDKHMDNFPVLEEPAPISNDDSNIETFTPVKDTPAPKSYINVRPLSELIVPTETNPVHESSASFPKIHSVVSLGTPTDPLESKEENVVKAFKYEEAQVEIMSQKHRIVLETMLSPEKLIQLFKCAGCFCSYTTDNVEEALVHASTHKKIGGENSLRCSYCDFDPMGNAIDLVMHVFKTYNYCSFACSKCFYRASVSQLVYAHIKRAHPGDPDKTAVLSTATVTEDKSKDDILSRDQAVLYYICNNRDPENGDVCTFKSFVLTKFSEHLQMRHPNDKEYPCFMCNTATPSPKELALHLKTHGLRIYQCCRCLFGAENETELMAHASSVHPLKQPKAYLRIITSKGPNSEVRVLPLVVLSKASVPVTVVTPGTARENPVKEAERSIDLEKLIGHTTSMIESMETTNVTEPPQETPTQIEDSQILLESQESCSNALDKEIAESTPIEPPSEQTPVDQTTNNVVLKTEPVDIPQDTEKNTPISPPSDPDVVCLDSDDDSRQIIDLSMDDLPEKTPEENETLIVPRASLYKCSNCSIIVKTEHMFRKHLMLCFPKVGDNISCAHCSHSAPINAIVAHYTNHLVVVKRFSCTKCSEKFATKIAAGKHLKQVHNEPPAVKIPSGPSQYFAETERTERPKRKLSNDASKTSEPPAKLKKYGPEDVDRLPINPILDDLVYCSICEFSTKVRLNMVRHLQLHAEQQPVPRTAPVNPVPHLDTNEKHFDKMVNLASSSITPRSEKPNPTSSTVERLSAEAAALYPKFVPARTRYTCGAKYCTYISVNESIFKIHWETLHQGTNDYHCVHCPPHQHLDTSKPLTAVRIMAHLKMHDTKLYACSSCTFYHHTRKVLEKHLKEVHPGRVLVVREEGFPAPPAPAPPPPAAAAPTMDLKPWQCGLCYFKSMLRPEVIDHCGKFHQSKMQFKCTYCGFRTSNIENISKHQSKQHVGKKEEVFYFYYREGTIPDDPDGTPRWQKQSQKNPPEIKMEVAEPQLPATTEVLAKKVPPKPAVNLDIVKQEVIEPVVEETLEDLCKEFGQFCDPNGLKYKCSLCKIVVDDCRESMQSHLYEELQYRKWGCAICTYKAFHKPGLQSHVQTEHGVKRGAVKEPIELQVDPRIETWVTKFLDHQTTIIERNKENLAKQKAEIFRPVPGSSNMKTPEPQIDDQPSDKPSVSMAELESLFGPLGVPKNMNYCCPKCGVLARSEASMQEHLEMELLKMRWRCNTCNETFRTYHEVQFHCRSAHPVPARPVEAARDPALRAAWLAAVLRVQKLSMNYMPLTDAPEPPDPAPETPPEPDNSLLVVRYEENVPIPDTQMLVRQKSDSDDEKLVIDEASTSKPPAEPAPEIYACPRCPSTFKYSRILDNHLLKAHYGLKPFVCPYCDNCCNFRKQVVAHIKTEHPGMMIILKPTPIPSDDPPKPEEEPKPAEVPEEYVCLVCEKLVSPTEKMCHNHGDEKTEFGMKGAIVYRCCVCCTLHMSVTNFRIHHRLTHPDFSPNYSFYKLHNENRVLTCDICQQKFNVLAEFRKHKITKHNMNESSFSASMFDPKAVIEIDDEGTDEVAGKRKAEDAATPQPKKVAKKSTTKLPSASIAKKSTTKLPFNSNMEEYSYYGTKSTNDIPKGVTMTLPVMNNVNNFEALLNIFKKFPVVMVEDINKNKEK